MYPLSYIVSTPPAATALAEATNLRNVLGIASSDVGALTEIQLAVDAATGAINEYCGRVFARRGLAFRYRLYAYEFVLTNLPVVGSLLVEDGEGGRLDVEADLSGVVRRVDGEQFEGLLNVHYEGGYTLPSDPSVISPTLPADLEIACQDLAKWFYLRRARDPQVETEALSGIAAAGYAVPMGMPEDVASLIEPYRFVRI